MAECFIVPVNGLKPGKCAFDWHADGQFFKEFENSEVLDADIDIHTEVEKSGKFIGIDCTVEGTAVVSCDRCLGDLSLKVQTQIHLSVKFGEGESVAEEGGREIVMLPQDNAEYDMSQVIYDYVCTSLPVQKVHPEGGCDPEVVRYLNTGVQPEEPSDSPFAALKDMLKK